MSLSLRPIPIDGAPPERPDPRLHLASHDDAPWPWYRSDPWLAVELSALLPLVVSFLIPMEYRVPLVALGMVLVAIGLSMLYRQGSFHGRPRPQGPRSAARRPTG